MKLSNIYYHIRHPKNYKDFWILNQEFGYLEPFATFKKKKESAKIMMAIYMIYDPKSQLTNSGESIEKIKKDVSTNFLGKEKFDWTPYLSIVAAYKKYTKTKIEKTLDEWWNQLKEREEFLNELEWEDQAQLKEGMLLKTDEHFMKYHNILSLLKEERQETLMHGGYTLSWIEEYANDV